jgi:hypothetical protein
MIRSRWLLTYAATVAFLSAPTAQAQCPFTAHAMMNVNVRFNAMPPMMMMPPAQMQQFRPQMMMPPHMPAMNVGLNRPMPGLGMPMAPAMRMRTPAMTMRVPTLDMHVGQFSHTQINRITTMHQTTFHLPMPHLNYGLHSEMARIGYGNHPGYGIRPGLTGHLTFGLKHLPISLTMSRSRLNMLTTRKPTVNFSLGNRMVRIPGLSRINRLEPNRPGLLAERPRPVTPERPGIVGRNLPVRPSEPPRPQMVQRPAIPSLSITGKLNFQCGACHQCKNQPQGNPGFLARQFPQPAPMPPVLPVVARPAPQPGVFVVKPRIPLQPFAPPVVYQPPPVILPGVIVPVRPLTLNDLVVAPRLPVNSNRPGLFQLPLPEKPTSVVTTMMPPDSPGTMNTEPTLPSILVDLKPPSMPATSEGNRLQPIPSMTELIVAAEQNRLTVSATGVATAGKPAVRRPTGPALIELLVQAPRLPSGATVVPLESPSTPLDDPPVLPTIAELLQLPPALPSPGTE